jgi:2,3,4,5-tetrahydropyridine-2-carboxylate N-succinyltransferase
MTARDNLRERIEQVVERGGEMDAREVRSRVEELLTALEAGEVRAASPEGDRWVTHAWVKQGILAAFRHSEMVELPEIGQMGSRDKAWLPPQPIQRMPRIRIVPGGSGVRRGAYVGDGVILMPPCYINVGAWVGPETMVDSHALVGSCAQIGRNVHLSAGAQVGGVLEPPGAQPVIVEDGAFIGALAAALEGVRVGEEVVLAAGVVLTASSLLYDVPGRRVIRRGDDGVLVVPPRSVVVPGTRPLRDEWAQEQGLQANAALIVKQRDAGTDARAALEDVLR